MVELQDKRAIAAQRITEAYAQRKKAGLSWGRTPKTFDVNLALKLRAEGKGYIVIARKVGVSPGTVRRRLLELEAPAEKKRWWGVGK